MKGLRRQLEGGEKSEKGEVGGGNTIILNEYYTIILENARGKKGEVGEEAGPPQVR